MIKFGYFLCYIFVACCRFTVNRGLEVTESSRNNFSVVGPASTTNRDSRVREKPAMVRRRRHTRARERRSEEVAAGAREVPLLLDPDVEAEQTGLILMVFQFLYRRRTLQLDLPRVIAMCRGNQRLWESQRMIPVIMVILQAMALDPFLRRTLRRWARVTGIHFRCPSRRMRYTRQLLQPWLDTQLWDFRVWAIAAALVARFLGSARPPMEIPFLFEAIRRFSTVEDEEWILEVMVHTLFMVLGTPWFWRVLWQTRSRSSRHGWLG